MKKMKNRKIWKDLRTIYMRFIVCIINIMGFSISKLENK